MIDEETVIYFFSNLVANAFKSLTDNNYYQTNVGGQVIHTRWVSKVNGDTDFIAYSDDWSLVTTADSRWWLLKPGQYKTKVTIKNILAKGNEMALNEALLYAKMM